MVPKLIILSGVQEGMSFSISQEVTSIGRDRECDLRLEDPTCSRVHSKIERRGKSYYIHDAGSYNGTIVNRRRVDSAELFCGDKIKIGQSSIQFDLSIIEQWLVKTQADVAHKDRDVDFEPDLDTDFDVASTENAIVPSQELLSTSLPSNTHEDLRFVVDAGHEIAARHSRRELLFELLGLIKRWLGAKQGAAFILDRGKLEFSNCVVRTSGAKERAEDTIFRLNRNMLNLVRTEKRGFVSEFSVADEGQKLKAFAFPVMCMDEIVAIIYFDSLGVSDAVSASWGEERLRILTTVAKQAGLAIENREMFNVQITKERFAAVGEITSFISHRVNNILQVINGGSYLVDIGLETANPELVAKGWDIVKRSQNRITRLTSNLLAYSRVFEPKCEACPIVTLFNNAVEAVSDTFETTKIEATHVSVDDCTVFVDQFFTTRIIENLLAVALAASIELPEEKIKVTISADPEYCNLSIEFQHLDDRFNLVGMLEGAASKLKAEMGRLELMLSKRQIEAQHGKFSVANDDGEINYIRIRLPRHTISDDDGTLGAQAVPQG